MKHIVKRLAACGLACLISVSVLSGPDASFTVSAHSGRTDSNGGHHDYKNKSGLGSYHYHHGYPAHLHEGGVCPYDAPQPAAPQPSVPEPVPAVPAAAVPQPAASAPPASEAAAVPQPAVSVPPASEAAAADIAYTLVFDASFYAAANPDVAAVYGTDAASLYQHFLTAGMQEGRQGCATFNVWTYKAANPDLAALFGDDLKAYYTYYCLTNG